MTDNIKYIYESPDKGKTVYRREFGKLERELVQSHTEVLNYVEENIEPTDRVAK